jgi:hypothetical protein
MLHAIRTLLDAKKILLFMVSVSASHRFAKFLWTREELAKQFLSLESLDNASDLFGIRVTDGCGVAAPVRHIYTSLK